MYTNQNDKYIAPQKEIRFILNPLYTKEIPIKSIQQPIPNRFLLIGGNPLQDFFALKKKLFLPSKINSFPFEGERWG